jgi:hypothetical protein
MGKIVRWAARFASLPILALVLISLVPSLLSFSVLAPDDKTMAACLGGTCLGLLLGWLWAGIGGLIIVASVAGMLAQGDNLRSPDPFSVAFGLQGLLFLLSWALAQPTGPAAPPKAGLVKKFAAGLFVLGALGGVAVLVRGPGPTPLTKEREVFIGVWDSGKGLKVEFTAEGTAKVTQEKDAKVDSWNSPVKPGETAEFSADFGGDDRLELSSGPLRAAKVYHIDRRPRQMGKQIRMVLNGSDPYKPGGGVVMVKQQGK